jgi:hypothetical protein
MLAIRFFINYLKFMASGLWVLLIIAGIILLAIIEGRDGS